ncbi:MAG TPA: hypothetical protein VJO16_17315 [Candidatus Acidoferrum sp.]|nr:hypothetical protein [Candidatus Acidoferrum sp.]
MGAVHDGKFEVGIEFVELAPRFWRVAFSPEDWSPRSPEAKRRTATSAVAPLKAQVPK